MGGLFSVTPGLSCHPPSEPGQTALCWPAPYEPSSRRLVYTTPLRVQANGYYQARLPLADSGRYRVVVQLLNDLGGIEEEEASVFEARF